VILGAFRELDGDGEGIRHADGLPRMIIAAFLSSG